MRPIRPKARAFLRQAPPDTPIRIYTIQHHDVWTRLCQDGWIHGDHPHADPYDDRPYDWMVEQMRGRIPGYSGHRPIWASLKQEPKRHYSLYGGTHDAMMVEMAAVIPLGRALCSDYGLYNSVMNNTPLGSIGRAWLDDPDYVEDPIATRASWDTIFDLHDRVDDADLWGQPNDIQLTVDRLFLHEVYTVRDIPSRRRRTGRTRRIYHNPAITLPPPIHRQTIPQGTDKH